MIRDFKYVEKINPITAPNICAVASFDGKQKGRVYLINKPEIINIYKGIENALIESEERIQKIRDPYNHIIAVSYGRIPNEKDIYIYPFEKSINGIERVKDMPYQIKNNQRMTWRLTEGGDHHLILGPEELHRRRNINNFEKFINKFPDIEGIKYLDTPFNNF